MKLRFQLIFTLTFVAALALSSIVRAQSPEIQRTGIEDVRNATTTMTRLIQNNMAPLAAGWFTDCGQEGHASQECADAYADLYKKPVVKFTVTLGYTDVQNDFADPRNNYLAAEDSIRREVWEQKLRRPCPKDDDGAPVRGTCDFKKNADDADLFTKTVVGPDGKDHTVELRLTHSSVSYSDAGNRVAGRTQQDLQTKQAERNFFDRACESDGVFYAGHWRLGAGASFAPPPLKPGTVAVNFAAFKGKESEQRLLATLRNCPNPPKILGLFACNSASASSVELRAATKNRSGVITSASLAEPEVVYAQAYSALDSLLTLRCAGELDAATNSVKNVKRRDGRGTLRTGFFGDSHPRFQCPSDEAPVSPGNRAQTPLVPEKPIHPAGEPATGVPLDAGQRASESLK